MPEHGTRTMYVGHGCRCEPCVVANRTYNRNHRRHLVRAGLGIEERRQPFTDATEAREHIAWLRSRGVGLRAIAARAGVGKTALQKIADGKRQRITVRMHNAVLAVHTATGPAGQRVDAAPTWRLLDDLIAQGHTRTSIARALGQLGPGLQISRRTVLRRTAEAVRDLHYRWAHEGSTTRYADGCRCLACRNEAAAYQRARRARGAA